MGLSTALNIAKSGLGVSAIRADIISRNIANAETAGYTRKTVAQTTDSTGGPKVTSIDRTVDALLDRLNLSNLSKVASTQTMADGMSAYTDYLGQPSDEIAPTKTLSDLNSAFVTLSSGVNTSASQLAALASAQEMADHFNKLSGTLAEVGKEVEMNIRYDVADLNKALDAIASLNGKILLSGKGTVLTAEHQDEMGKLLETVSSFLDIQTVTDQSGMVSVLTSGGTELVKGKVVHDVTYDGGAGTLMAGRVEITPDQGNRAFTSGSLYGLFSLKNETLPEFNLQLDTMAAAMIQSFEAAAPLGAAGLGLFTDAGTAYDPTNIAGMAARIRINTEVDPDQGGDVSLLQKGTNPARAPGDSSVVDAMLAIFSKPVGVPTGNLGSGDIVTLMAGMVSSQQMLRADAQSNATAAATSAATISASRENLQGVNVDDELQKLLLVEQSYAANSKVLTTVTQMLDDLLAAV
ncbi:flagellar hook-associated protein FlgK [Paracoccus litorisediminis]|uniref:flagellar hook-associated protein FlgK n=1 Tax=Paracoccus litorisediminis TaxID=2006130 RepID=UPI00372F6EA9